MRWWIAWTGFRKEGKRKKKEVRGKGKKTKEEEEASAARGREREKRGSVEREKACLRQRLRHLN